jgi:hypothetical protein
VSLPAPDSPPPGWYPDPSGQRQWRVWTGVEWSALTKSYGDAVTVTRLAPNLALVQALSRVMNVGIIGVIAGLGLLIGVVAHLPGSVHPAPAWFVAPALGVASALLVIGSVACAFGVRALTGRWITAAFLPGLNLFVASALVAERLDRRKMWRLLSEILLLIIFATTSHNDLWLCITPVLVAYVEASWFATLIDRLKGPPSEGAPAS